MKKVLLGSTALLSAALLSHGARADDQPVKIGISGYYQSGYMVNLHESPSSSTNMPDAVGQYGQLNFSGDTKFADGIGAGVFIQMYGFNHHPVGGSNGGVGQIEQSWLHITGAEFGEFRIGDQNDIRRAKSVTAPEFANYLFGVNSPDLLLDNATGARAVTSNTTTAPLGSDYAPAVAWFSPTVSGFQFAVSYAPDNTQGAEGFGATGSYLANANVTLRDKYSSALTWSGSVYGLTMNASAAISGATEKNATFDPTTGALVDGVENPGNPFIWNVGYSVGWGPWAVGADYEQYKAPGGDGARTNRTVDLGFTYTIGNWVAGAEVSRGAYKGFYGADTAKDPTLTQAIIGATYNLGPGVSVSGGVETSDWDNNGLNAAAGGAAGYDNIALLIGSNINF
jgi:outer membrane protein OmpU